MAGWMLAFALAAAQSPATELAEQPIVVTGTPESREQRRDRAVDFVRRSGAVAGERPVARWLDPVCPRVIGIAPRHARLVESGMRRVAQDAGIRVGAPGCRTNILVAFGENGTGTMAEVARRAGRHLLEVPGQARDTLFHSTAPVRWFYSTETRSRHGMRGGDNPMVEAGNAESFFHYNSSLVSTQTVRALHTATVVIDISSMDRLPLQALIDYASLVAFAELIPSEFAPAGSILGLFGAEPGARALTRWDSAFLRALYRLPLDREGRRQRGILVRELVAAADAEGG